LFSAKGIMLLCFGKEWLRLQTFFSGVVKQWWIMGKYFVLGVCWIGEVHLRLEFPSLCSTSSNTKMVNVKKFRRSLGPGVMMY
jgi:hypothetical protein